MISAKAHIKRNFNLYLEYIKASVGLELTRPEANLALSSYIAGYIQAAQDLKNHEGELK